MSRPATQAEADAFAREMCLRFYARLIRKSMAPEMTVLGTIFDVIRLFGVQLPVGGDFVTRWATTLGPFVYMPDGLTPDEQIETLTHELMHVKQFWSGGAQSQLPAHFGMAFLYLTEPEARVRLEVEAHRAGLEVAWARRRALPSPEALTVPLERGYALPADQVTHARDLLESACSSIAVGTVSTDVGRAAIDVLRRLSPELLA